MKASLHPNNPQRQNNVRKYPYLGQYNNVANPFVVLFYEKKQGIVIAEAKTSRYQIGHSDDDWCEEQFIPLHPSQQVILSND